MKNCISFSCFVLKEESCWNEEKTFDNDDDDDDEGLSDGGWCFFTFQVDVQSIIYRTQKCNDEPRG